MGVSFGSVPDDKGTNVFDTGLILTRILQDFHEDTRLYWILIEQPNEGYIIDIVGKYV